MPTSTPLKQLGAERALFVGDFPLTQVDLAETMGMSTVHMNRSLQELRRAELIELCRNRLTILDLPRLEMFAQFEPSYPHFGEKAAA